MRCYILLVCLTIPWADGQRGRQARQHHNSHGWDIRLAVPGEPGNDYPVLNTIPRTSFSCAKKTPGYYADVETNCQVFRVCTLGSTYSFQSFLCPNGTLFNQAVFVCDWWMNVNCVKSVEHFNNNEKYSNLRIGPQLMSDVKNMLTHSVRNPYNKVVMKNKMVVMQEYKPPTEQPQTNEGYYVKSERDYDKYFTNVRQDQKITNEKTYNSLDSFVASTSNPRYLSTFNAFPPSATRIIQEYQTQSHLNSQKIQQNSPNIRNFETNDLFNGQKIRMLHNLQMPFNTVSQPVQHNQYLRTSKNQGYRVENRDPNNHENTDNRQQVFSHFISNHKPKQSLHNNHFQEYPQISTQTKQNSVSIDVPSTIVTKTLTYRRTIQNPKQGQPRSRITFKKWIVKPTRTARLVTDTIAYTYDIPTSPAENIVADNSYFYNKPTRDNSNQKSLPTVSVNPLISSFEDNIIPTIPTPNLSSNLYLAPVSTRQTKPALLYLPPTTYKPASLIYIPPTQNSKLISKLNFPDNDDTKDVKYENITENNPLYSITKKLHINAKHKNLTFSDILTKEKLDITVNDIVKDTNKIIKTASLVQDNKNKQNVPEPENYYIAAKTDSSSDEEITTASPVILSSISRLVASPSVVLEPPKQYANVLQQNSNRLSNLPFFRDPALPKNTIERTVSLKITIPEKVADLLFKNQSIAQSDNLEVLNTEGTNYLVLNKKKTNQANNNVIPIVKLSWNDNSNVSDSQELVYSFLADSIKSAKQYTNIIQQEPVTLNSSSSSTQTDNYKNVNQIANSIADLTSEQYTNNSISTKKQMNFSKQQLLKENKDQTQQKLQRVTQLQQNKLPDSEVENLQINSNNIYSGQFYKLPVPIVTQKIYNAPFSNNFIRPSNDTKSWSSKNNDYINDTYKDKDKSLISNLNRIKSEAYEQQSLNEQHYTDNSLVDDMKSSENRISAHIQDKTVGTIQHPLEENKQITYKNDKSFIVYTQLNNDGDNFQQNLEDNTKNTGNLYSIHKLPYNSDISNFLTFQLLPSIAYNLESEKENRKIINEFEVDEFRTPKPMLDNNKRRVGTADIDYVVDHPKTLTESQQFTNFNTLYDGPSSYYPPQLSVGNLKVTQSTLPQSDRNSNIEDLSNKDEYEDEVGYSKVTPLKRFLF